MAHFSKLNPSTWHGLPHTTFPNDANKSTAQKALMEKRRKETEQRNREIDTQRAQQQKQDRSKERAVGTYLDPNQPLNTVPPSTSNHQTDSYDFGKGKQRATGPFDTPPFPQHHVPPHAPPGPERHDRGQPQVSPYERHEDNSYEQRPHTMGWGHPEYYPQNPRPKRRRSSICIDDATDGLIGGFVSLVTRIKK